ncbi:hypothetical protein BKA83DRAFT_20427, partial [Pisolithus microcarpus]
MTIGHPSAIIALCRSVSAKLRLTSAYLHLCPPASVSIGDRRSQPELNRCELLSLIGIKSHYH